MSPCGAGSGGTGSLLRWLGHAGLSKVQRVPIERDGCARWSCTEGTLVFPAGRPSVLSGRFFPTVRSSRQGPCDPPGDCTVFEDDQVAAFRGLPARRGILMNDHNNRSGGALLEDIEMPAHAQNTRGQPCPFIPAQSILKCVFSRKQLPRLGFWEKNMLLMSRPRS